LKDYPKNYREGVTLYLCTLNDSDKIDSCLNQLNKSQFNQLIVVDGSSKDNSVNIAKRYTEEVYVTEAGFVNQINEVFKHAKFEYLIGLEADVSMPENFIIEFVDDFKSKDYAAMQANIKCLNKENYWNRGLSAFYETHHKYVGEKNIIGGPNIYKTAVREEFHKELSSQGYSIDTEMAEIIKSKGYKMGLSSVTAFQHTSLNFKKFCRKYFNYGKGDYDFYRIHKNKWTYSRKAKSITHTLRRHMINYPFKAIIIGRGFYVPYFLLSAIIRYFGWIWSIFNSKLFKKI
tara:strand:- start:304 stop:1170 length:867 start_codon:yes stop_codon:yes gene_type:complete